MNPIPVVFWGTPHIAARLLQALIEDDRFEIRAVITQPDKARSVRGRKVQPSPVKKLAAKNAIEVLQPVSFKKEKDDLFDRFTNLDPLFHIVLAYGRIIPEKLFSQPEKKSVNFHASILPKLRGASPVETALLRGNSESGWTLQQITEELDAGDIFWKRAVPVADSDIRDSLFNKLTAVLSEEGPTALLDYAEDRLVAEKQNHEEATYCTKFSADDAHFSCDEPAVEVRNRARAFSEKPGIFTEFQGKKLKIWPDFSVSSSEISMKQTDRSPGTITGVKKEYINIAMKDAELPVKTVQLEGKKAVNAVDFINGYRLKEGDRLI